MGLTGRFLNWVEYVGNKLPHPITLFIILAGMVMVASAIFAALDVSVIHPAKGETVAAISLFDAEQLRRIFVEMSETFAGFPPLGMVLVIMIGMGLAERTGFIGTALSALVRWMPDPLLTATVVFAGIMSSIAVDAGYVVMVPLGAVLFLGAGRHPVAGLAAAFAGVSGGFSANLSITSLDPLLAGISKDAAQLLDPAYNVLPTANWYMMIVLVPVFTLVGTLITDRIIEPRLGAYKGTGHTEDHVAETSDDERRGMKAALITFILFAIGITAMTIPEGGVFNDAEHGLTPLWESMVAIMTLLFLLVGLAYGFFSKALKKFEDAIDIMMDTMGDMGFYIVLSFFAAHFIAFFKWSNLGLITAITGASGLESIGFTGMPLIVSFVIVAAFLNLFMGSASAKWAVMATIFVPMLMLMGYSPELTQASYRIGDSVTNILTPLMHYFPLIITFGLRYDKNFGIGTLAATMLPYSVLFFIFGIITLAIFFYSGIPLGPDAPYTYDATGMGG